jgi:hypothetical protein
MMARREADWARRGTERGLRMRQWLWAPIALDQRGQPDIHVVTGKFTVTLLKFCRPLELWKLHNFHCKGK